MSEPKPHVSVYAFEDAPQAWQDLSRHDGDEDTIWHVPASLIDEDGEVRMRGLVRAIGYVDLHDVYDETRQTRSWDLALRFHEVHRLEDGSVLIICAH